MSEFIKILRHIVIGGIVIAFMHHFNKKLETLVHKKLNQSRKKINL